jgi:hypothetical protein
MPLLPALGMLATVDNFTDQATWPYDDGWQGAAYRWTVQLTVDPQVHGSVETPNYQSYDGTDVRAGMWIGHIVEGKACQIISINSASSTNIEVVVEDVDRYNILSDYTLSGFGGLNQGRAFIFNLNEDGEPMWGDLAYTNSTFTQNFSFFNDLTARFRHRNKNKTYYSVTQTNNGFAVGDPIMLGSSGAYTKAIADTDTNASKAIGFVTSIGVPGPDDFTYRPLGRLIRGVSLTGIGNPGDVIYLDPAVAGGLTATKPANAKPLYVKINNTTAVSLYGGGGGGGGGGGAGLARYVAGATTGEEVQVLASGSSGDISYARQGNVGTFTIGAGARLISARARIPGSVPSSGQMIFDTGTADMANSSLANKWLPEVTATREDTGNMIPITCTMNGTSHSQFIVNNLPSDTTSHVRLTF